ncbi:hypothetical protein SprV_0200996800 [Sparganum proliferum]
MDVIKQPQPIESTPRSRSSQSAQSLHQYQHSDVLPSIRCPTSSITSGISSIKPTNTDMTCEFAVGVQPNTLPTTQHLVLSSLTQFTYPSSVRIFFPQFALRKERLWRHYSGRLLQRCASPEYLHVRTSASLLLDQSRLSKLGSHLRGRLRHALA